MNKVITILKTLRYLSPAQLVSQVWITLRVRFEDPAGFAQETPVPAYPGCRWSPRGEFLPPGIQQNRKESMQKGSFSFLNVVRETGWPPRWDREDLPKHWLFNLHYFDFIWALEFEDARFLVMDWIETCKLSRGRTGWDSYPISLRLMNLSAYFFSAHRDRTEADAPFRNMLWESIFLQAEWLGRHMETNVGGNHLIENVSTLALAGSCFNGAEAGAWFRKGCRLLAKEIARQVLPDGAHVGRSPMYQCRMTYVLATLLNTGDPRLAELVREPLCRMAEELSLVCHPDGDIALFNDSASAVYNRPIPLVEYVAKLTGTKIAKAGSGTGAFGLSSIGFYGAGTGKGAYVIVDAGPGHHRFIPGHGHGGMFGFELSWGGRRCVVDGGVYDYAAGEMRNYCKSTRAHNTVEIGGCDQNEYWDVFRVASLGLTRDVWFEKTATGFRVSGWHDGYRRLPGRPRHERQMIWHSQALLMVRDRVTAAQNIQAVTRLHLHPDCKIRSADERNAVVEVGDVAVRIVFAGPGRLQVEKSFYCPEFGKKLDNQALAYTCEGSDLSSAFAISCLPGDTALDIDAGATIDGTRYAW
jgi:uncharacterized heparinase superfamily protein